MYVFFIEINRLVIDLCQETENGLLDWGKGILAVGEIM